MPFDATPITSPDIELLEKVREFFRKNGWCQGSPARDSWGDRTAVYEANAASFCLIGSYIRVKEEDEGADEFDHFANLLGFYNQCDMIDWNDANGRTRRGVLNKISKRITKLRAELLERVH